MNHDELSLWMEAIESHISGLRIMKLWTEEEVFFVWWAGDLAHHYFTTPF